MRQLITLALVAAAVSSCGVFGEARPVVPNDSIANRALNRRAEIVITPAELNLRAIDVNPATLQK